MSIFGIAGGEAQARYEYAKSLPVEFYENIEFESYLDRAASLFNMPADVARSYFAIPSLRSPLLNSLRNQNPNQFIMAAEWYKFQRGLDGAGGGYSGPTQAQRAAQAAAELRNFAGQFGVSDYADWDAIGADAAANNWSASQIRDLVATFINADSLNRAGYVRDVYDKTMATGAQYFVRLGAEEVLDYAKQIASDDLNEESLLGIIKQRAKAQYSWLSDVIDSGTSLQDYFKPHRDEIARLMEISPEAINFMDDPKWQKIVQRPGDANDNSLRSMTLFETQQYVRSLEDWKKTNNARTDAANMVGALAQVFGGM